MRGWQEARDARNEGLARMVADLDRCCHGRHRGDACTPCGLVSEGNPHLPPGQVIGWDMSGRPYRVPERTASDRSVQAWLPARVDRPPADVRDVATEAALARVETATQRLVASWPAAGCTCIPDPDTGALHDDIDGWPCSHGS